jgi:hypothetical protein
MARLTEGVISTGAKHSRETPALVFALTFHPDSSRSTPWNY